MLESDEFIATHRSNPTDLTRLRTLTLSMLVICLAQGFIKGLQSELDDFFGRLGNQAAFASLKGPSLKGPGSDCFIYTSSFNRAWPL